MFMALLTPQGTGDHAEGRPRGGGEPPPLRHELHPRGQHDGDPAVRPRMRRQGGGEVHPLRDARRDRPGAQDPAHDGGQVLRLCVRGGSLHPRCEAGQSRDIVRRPGRALRDNGSGRIGR